MPKKGAGHMLLASDAWVRVASNGRYAHLCITAKSRCSSVCLNGHEDSHTVWLQIGIGASLTARPLPHHRAYGSVHGDSAG